LLDPELAGGLLTEFTSGSYDHAGLEGLYPDGLDCEVFSFEALLTARNEAELGSEREHVTPFIWKRPQRFSLYTFRAPADYSTMRWTVDDERDLEFVRAVYAGFKCSERPFGMREVLDYLSANPELLEINAGTMRNAGYAKSLGEDK